MKDASLLNQIDALEDTKVQAEDTRDQFLETLPDHVMGIANNEVAYELASAAPLDKKVDLTEIANDIYLGRTALTTAVDLAINSAKSALRATHEQALLREQIVSSVTSSD